MFRGLFYIIAIIILTSCCGEQYLNNDSIAIKKDAKIQHKQNYNRHHFATTDIKR